MTYHSHVSDLSVRVSSFLENDPIRPVIPTSFPVTLRPDDLRFLAPLVPTKAFGFPYGQLTIGFQPIDSIGVTTFHTCETRVGWMSSLPRGIGVQPTRFYADLLILPNFIEQPLTMIHIDAASSRIHFRSSVHPFSSPIASLWLEALLDIPSSFEPGYY